MQLDKLVFTFFNGEIAARYLPQVLQGALVTIELGAAVIAAGLALGLLLAYLRTLPSWPLRCLVVGFVDILRAMPPLVLIILFYFALPFVGLPMGPFAATWLALSLVLAAFSEEVFWAGIETQPRGLMEAARSTGLGHTQAMAWVVLPQACSHDGGAFDQSRHHHHQGHGLRLGRIAQRNPQPGHLRHQLRRQSDAAHARRRGLPDHLRARRGTGALDRASLRPRPPLSEERPPRWT